MKKKTDILIVGVGGQGIILASEILADVGREAGFDVKKSEVHGMSQRGGSVSTHVRFDRKVFSPLIRQGKVDFLLAFELLEALRWVNFLSSHGVALVNNLKINPTTVSSGPMEYPSNIEHLLKESGHTIQLIEGISLAEQAGGKRAMNIVLLGALSGFLPNIAEEMWLKVIRSRVPAKTLQANEKAFYLGLKEA
jgi:indolepyruvate ferredoxin oxidoreductase beta subunit